MVAWQELHIQSNLPLIVLAVSFICIVIIGFLEFKKVSIRMDELSEQIKLLRTIKREPLTNDNNDNNDNGNGNNDNGNNGDNGDTMEPQKDIPMNEETIVSDKEEPLSPMNTSITIERMPPPSMDNIMMSMGMPPNIAGMMFQGDIPPPLNSGEENPNIYEEDIEGKDGNNEIEEDRYSETEDGFSSSGSSNVSESESDIEDLDTDLEKEEKEEKEGLLEVDRTSSIKELRGICQKMGLPSSGNKEQLIRRINSQNEK